MNKDKTIEMVMNQMLEFITIKKWNGACYASAAINHVLLKALGVSSTPYLGVVKASSGECFDHGWLEIDGLIYDTAITMPKQPSYTHLQYSLIPKDFIGFSTNKFFTYGINMGLDDHIKCFLVNFPLILENTCALDEFETNLDVAYFIAGRCDMQVTKTQLSDCARNSEWRNYKK